MEDRDKFKLSLNDLDGVFVRKADAGSYLIPEIPELDVKIEEFSQIVRELAGVTITPGTEFGPQFFNHFQINFSQDRQAAVAAIKRTIEVMERYRK